MSKARVGIIAGVALTILGLGASIWIGPDDWIDSPMQVVNAGGEVGVATTYGFLSHTLPLRVTARADAGDVFVGVGHVVDVDDYVAGARVTRMEWFSPGGVQTAPAPSGGRLPAMPTSLDIWQQHATGPGEQRLDGEFAGQPVVAFVAAVDGQSRPLHISVGSQLRGAFGIGLIVASIGAALAAVMIVRTRHGRAAEQSAAPVSDEHPQPRSALRFIAVLITPVLATTGCTAQPIDTNPPHVVPLPPRETVRRDPLMGLSLTTLAADYDRRNNAAIAAASAPRYSTREWEQADADLMLGVDHYVTAWDRESRNKQRPSICKTTLHTAFPAAATPNYPIAVVVTRSMSCDGKPPAHQALAVYTRQHAISAWRLSSEVSIAEKDLPKPGTGQPSPQDIAQLASSAEDLATYVSTGKAGTVAVPASLAKQRALRVERTKWDTGRWLGWLTPGSVQIAQTSAGPIAVVSLRTHWHLTGNGDQTIGWTSKAYARVLRQPGYRRTLDVQFGLTAALGLNGGKATVLAWDLTTYLD